MASEAPNTWHRFQVARGARARGQNATGQLRATGIRETALHVGDLPTLNGNGQWVLPVPATFVIDRHGRVAFAHVDADYRERAEPADVLRRLQTMVSA